ncbi:UDP-glycosyltransferase UGT5 isoform X2 [Hyalella azteca]|nr:UDP-glycosyltransferase UGT5 isoform X2 [Hyalella azteca]XP_018018966.1 UDP-glycosyltransferase UGT5 isoform X2 [Hyalella azteca]XP_047737305.1 UDP-glycosyltransferase UGT5 isoform X2 [Hyalella azteca]XP_047737306.1 UDP-glycosyltransferase UGT5 isoform X2 [Hyalella azteca]
MACVQLLVVAGLVAMALPPAVAALPPPERPYKILMLLPVSSRSHRNVFMPLATALTERGHQVTMVSNSPLTEERPGLTHFENPLPHFKMDTINTFEMMDNMEEMFKLFNERLPLIAREIYDVPVIRDLYQRRKEFDLVILSSLFNEVMLPFTHNHTFITISTSGLDPVTSSVMGNTLNPAYVPNGLEVYKPLTTLGRWKNLIMTIVFAFTFGKSLQAPIQAEIEKRFPELPSFSELERNLSLTLMNSHFSTGLTVPLLPNQVEVGGLHIEPTKALPKNLLDFLSGTTPVVYMSLGSVTRSSAMRQEHKDIFFRAFAKIPYKVLWKFEEEPQEKLNNLLVQKWMPQQDILAHPNVKVFISHCGLLGSLEALYFGTPILGLPVFADQPKNAESHELAGVGRKILWPDLTEELLISAIEDLINNPRYEENVQAISASMKDRPMRAVDTAVYWTEYVIRHQGALHLRSPERDLTWVELLYLDLLVVIHIILVFIYVVIIKLTSLCFGGKDRDGKSKTKKE